MHGLSLRLRFPQGAGPSRPSLCRALLGRASEARLHNYFPERCALPEAAWDAGPALRLVAPRRERRPWKGSLYGLRPFMKGESGCQHRVVEAGCGAGSCRARGHILPPPLRQSLRLLFLHPVSWTINVHPAAQVPGVLSPPPGSTDPTHLSRAATGEGAPLRVGRPGASGRPLHPPLRSTTCSQIPRAHPPSLHTKELPPPCPEAAEAGGLQGSPDPAKLP